VDLIGCCDVGERCGMEEGVCEFVDYYVIEYLVDEGMYFVRFGWFDDVGDYFGDGYVFVFVVELGCGGLWVGVYLVVE